MQEIKTTTMNNNKQYSESQTSDKGVETRKSITEYPLKEGGVVYICCYSMNGPKAEKPAPLPEGWMEDSYQGETTFYIRKEFATLANPIEKTVLEKFKEEGSTY